MIRVLHLITGLDVGGTEMMLYKLVTRSNLKKFRHTVVSMLPGGALQERIQTLGVPVYTLNMSRGSPSLRGLCRFLAIVRYESPDILQTWLYHADLLGLVVKFFKRLPIVWNIRSTFHPGLTSIVAKLCALLSWMPAVVVINSQAGRNFYSRFGYKPKEWRLIPNGFDLQEFAPDTSARRSVRDELGLSEDVLLIGLIARFDPLKDHSNFLRAAGLLALTDPTVHFVLVGEGVTLHNPFFTAQVAQERLTGCVHLLGSRMDICRLTASLDIATSASSNEGFPNTIGEAMACGVPCVVTDVGDSAWIVGNTGIQVPPKEPYALADGWRALIHKGAEGRKQLGQAARERIQQLFSLEQAVRLYEDLYASLGETGSCECKRRLF